MFGPALIQDFDDALNAHLNSYRRLIGSGDCGGTWYTEQSPEVVRIRALWNVIKKSLLAEEGVTPEAIHDVSKDYPSTAVRLPRDVSRIGSPDGSGQQDPHLVGDPVGADVHSSQYYPNDCFVTSGIADHSNDFCNLDGYGRTLKPHETDRY